VSQPLTDYMRYEFVAYGDIIAACEQVHVVPRAALTAVDQGWASEYFWTFDDELVVLISYDDDGRVIGAQQAEDATPYLEARQRALSVAVASLNSKLEELPGSRPSPRG
jgi:hypothetical protein